MSVNSPYRYAARTALAGAPRTALVVVIVTKLPAPKARM